MDWNPTDGVERELGLAATTHAIRELDEKGIRRVRVIDPRRLDDVARNAVRRVLASEIGDLDVPDGVRSQLAERALVRLRETLADPSPRPTAKRDLRSIIEVEQARLRDLAEGKDGPSPSPGQLQAEEVQELEKRLVSDLTSILENDWRRELEQVQDSHRQQLGLLEQRISKLVRALESTDRVIEHLQRDARGSDAPPPSGDEAECSLDPASPLFEKKSQLLSALFQANLELKQLEGEDAPD